MIWTVMIFGTVIGCLCGMAVSNMFTEQKEKQKERKK